MTILANILAVKTSTVQIELPGRCFATLHYSEISDELRDKLQSPDAAIKPLNQIFTNGSYLPVRVVHISKVEKGCQLHVTTRPNIVNSDVRHDHLKRGMVVWGVATEKLEHGYRIECGVRDCRAFMPFGNVEEGKRFGKWRFS